MLQSKNRTQTFCLLYNRIRITASIPEDVQHQSLSRKHFLIRITQTIVSLSKRIPTVSRLECKSLTELKHSVRFNAMQFAQSLADGSESLCGRIQYCRAKTELKHSVHFTTESGLQHPSQRMFSINPCPGNISDQDNTNNCILVQKNSNQDQSENAKQNSKIQSALSQ